MNVVAREKLSVRGRGVSDTPREYRVRWRRQGLGHRSKLYQSREPADRLARILRGEEPRPRPTGDPDAFECCWGYECGCAGMTNREAWAEADRLAEERAARFPPLVRGPIIDSRPVGVWAEVRHGA